MPSFTDLTTAEFVLVGLNMLGGCFALAVTMQARRRLFMPCAVRLLGVMILTGMLSACSAPTKTGDEIMDKARQTPQERYFDQVYGLVQKKWDLYRAQSPNDRAYGSLRVLFYVGQEGKVEQIHVKNNQDTDPVLTKFTVKAIQDSKLPPMPAEVIPLLKNGPEMGMEFNILIRLKPRGAGGNAFSRGLHLNAETKKLMEKRWGAPPETRESNVRQEVAREGAAKLPMSAPTKGRDTTVKLTSTPLERYYRQVTGQVEKKWRIYLQLRPGVLTKGYLKLVFYVNKMGKVEDLRIVNAKDSNPLLTEITLRAVKDAEIPRMPVEVMPLLPKNDAERLKIEYDALIY